MSRVHDSVAVAAGLVLALIGWRLDHAAFLGAYLALWLFWIGILIGGLANVWLHSLTGGDWGEAVRAPLLSMGRSIWLAALMFLPVLAGMRDIYPWAAAALPWSDTLAAPAFKAAWLVPGGFAARSVACLMLWSVLGLLSSRPALQRSRPFAAAALILYGFSISVAGLDWVMSLMPLWYSSVFGLALGTAHMYGGMALAIIACTRARTPADTHLSGDLGNLLMMYVLCLAYLQFVQFLIIWSANLPHEIMWYVARSGGAGSALAWLQALALFALPLAALLFRSIKRQPPRLRRIAQLVLCGLLVHAGWLVLPSLAVVAWHGWAELLMVAPLLAAVARLQRSLPAAPLPLKEVQHG